MIERESRQPGVPPGSASGATAPASTPAPVEPSSQPPPHIPDHELLRCIGRGSYGEVWLARCVLGRYRAVKIVHRTTFDSDRPYDREFEGIRKFEPISRSHQSQVDILHVGRNEAEGYFYYVMELADDARSERNDGVMEERNKGPNQPPAIPPFHHSTTPAPLDPSSYEPKTLRSELKQRGRLPFDECLDIALALTTALDHLHSHGLIHRDIKPSNIIFVDGLPKLADIGLVATVDATCSFVGTEGYLPPEGPGTPQADLYSLGRVLYEMSTGKDRREFPDLPTELTSLEDRKGIVELNAVIVKACKADARERYQTAGQMHDDLLLLLAGKSVRRTHAMERRLRLMTRVIVVIAAVMALGAPGYFAAIREARRATRMAEQEAVQRQRADREAKTAKAQQKKAERAQVAETEARATAEQRVYDALLSEARALRTARRVGYRDQVFALLQQAKSLNVPQMDLADLRREAEACLGDFVGLAPTIISDFPTNTVILRMCLDPAGRSVAFLLDDKSVLLRELPDGAKIARFRLKGDLLTRGFCFNRSGDQLIFVRMTAKRQLEERILGARVNIWKRGEGQQWHEIEDFALPGALDCLSSASGVYVTTFDCERHLGRLVNVNTKAIVYRFDYPQEWIPEVALSPDGTILVVEATEECDSDNSVLDVWNLSAGRHLRRLAPQLGFLKELGFSPDGKHLECASGLSGAIYEAGGFNRVAEFGVHSRTPLAFAHGSVLAALPISQENRIRLWDWTRNEDNAVLDEPRPARAIAFAPDSSFLLTSCLDQARLYKSHVPSEQLIVPRHLGDRPCVAFSPDGAYVASAGKHPAVRVCEAATGRVIWESDAPPAQGHAVAYSPDGHWLATGDFRHHRVFVWNAHTGDRLLELTNEVSNKADGRLWSVQFSPDGRHLATASETFQADSGIRFWALERCGSEDFGETLEATLVKSVGRSTCSLAFAPDGGAIAFVDHNPWSDSSGLYVWKFSGQTAPRRLETDLFGGGVNVQSVGFTPDSRRLLIVNRTRSVVTLDAATGARVSAFPTMDSTLASEWTDSVGICLSPDGAKLATISASGRDVDIWDPRSGHLLHSLPGHKGAVYWLVWSPDSQRLAVSRSNGDISIWNVPEIERILAKLGLSQLSSSASGMPR